MMPMACPPVWWYHEEWDALKLYERQQAMMRFNAGLDPRGLGLRKLQTATSDNNNIFAQAKSGEGITLLYVFAWDNMSLESPEAVPEASWVRGAWVELTDVPLGHYRVEWWDAYEGRKLADEELEVTRSPVRIELPEFAQDLAAKLIEIK
jgi:hypothetical protein